MQGKKDEKEGALKWNRFKISEPRQAGLRRTAKGKCACNIAAVFQVKWKKRTVAVGGIRHWNQLSGEIMAWPPKGSLNIGLISYLSGISLG